MATDEKREQLAEGLEGSLLHLGMDIEAVDLTSAGRRSVLKIAVDKDGGVTLDDVAAATKAVSAVLDEPGPLGALLGERAYTLEVTSPGVDRPLTLPRHWRRNEGRLVKVTLDDGGTTTGRIAGHDESGAELDVDGSNQRVAYADVRSARIQIEFNRKES